jgi:hypothetical protein
MDARWAASGSRRRKLAGCDRLPEVFASEPVGATYHVAAPAPLASAATALTATTRTAAAHMPTLRQARSILRRNRADSPNTARPSYFVRFMSIEELIPAAMEGHGSAPADDDVDPATASQHRCPTLASTRSRDPTRGLRAAHRRVDCLDRGGRLSGRDGLDSLIGREEPIAPSPTCSLLCGSSYLLYRLQEMRKGDETSPRCSRCPSSHSSERPRG